MPNEEAARAALVRGEVQFVVNFPADFTRKLLRGERPALLIEADATDPAATGAAIASVRDLAASVARKDLTGALGIARRQAAAVRGARAQALQPGGHHAAQHRAGPDGRHPDDDHGDDDRPCDDARARARHDGEPARHAGAAAGGDDRKDRALHLHRVDPVHHHPARGALPVRRARSSAAWSFSTSCRCCSSPPT